MEVDPSLPILGRPDVSEVVLAERHAEDDLESLGDRPISVYVCTIEDREAADRGTIDEDDIHLIGWAEVARLPSLLPTERG